MEKIIDRAIDFTVGKTGELAEKAVLNSAKVGVVSSVLGIGTTAAGLTIMAANHANEIGRASKWIAGKLVR